MVYKSSKTKNSQLEDTNPTIRPFPRGFTPVLVRKSGPTVRLPPEIFEPVFLPPNLRSPILESENSNSFEFTTRHQSSRSAGSSSHTIKLICQSVLKLKNRRSEPELNASSSVEERSDNCTPKLGRSKSFRGLTRSPSIRFRKRRSKSQSRNDKNLKKEDVQIEEIVGGVEEPEPVEELMAEAIKIAMSEKGHRRQRSREIPPVGTDASLGFKEPDWFKLNFCIEPSSPFIDFKTV